MIACTRGVPGDRSELRSDQHDAILPRVSLVEASHYLRAAAGAAAARFCYINGDGLAGLTGLAVCSACT